MSVIVAENLSRFYGDETNQVRALDGVSLRVESGERVALQGKSGSGKTTLLNLLAGLDRPSTGQLAVDGQALEQLDSNRLADYRLRKIGVVFQSFQLLPHFSAVQNVELPLMLAGLARQERRAAATLELHRVGLAQRMHHRPYQLSGGEQQRVAIARAIVHRPPVLLADEPIGNLDSHTADQVVALMMEIIEETHAAMLLITHDRQLADRCATRILTLSDGKLANGS